MPPELSLKVSVTQNNRMMNPFLKQVAEHYFIESDIEKQCFIFPNRRSMAFFGKYLSEAVADNAMNRAAKGHNGVARPVLMPRMSTINDFFYSMSGMKETDRVTLLLYLYDCYKSALPKTAAADSLDDFIYWGDVLLADFNDVDKYLVRPDRLFANISEFRAIDSGLDDLEPAQREALARLVSHFREGDFSKTKTKHDFLRIWNMLYPVYSGFNKALNENGLCYEGMAYRNLAERMKEESVVDILSQHYQGVEKFIFVGLNALNECEKVVMKKMRDAGTADFCWDFSSDIIKDPENQSSKFMRDRFGTGNIDMFPQAFKLDDAGLAMPEIKVVSVPSAVGQASQIPLILKQVAGNDLAAAGRLSHEGKDCAIVIPDETMLLPLLNTIPPEIKDINVTMGYPMSGSTIFSLLKQVSDLQLHSRKRSDGVWSFYHRQVRTIFSNDIFRAAAGEKGQKIMDSIRREAKYYVPQSDFKGNSLLELVFSPIVTDQKSAYSEQTARLGNYILSVIKAVAASSAGISALEIELARKCWQSISLLTRKTLEVVPATYIRLIDQLLSSITVPFNGEPLGGLQIIGPLETRALDFSNLVILSANEGVFPKKSISSSFIPPEIRRGFGLPTYEYQDRVWAYYFYRMIQRAKRVWMIFDSRQEGLQSGEESRYIKQLEYIYQEKFKLKFERYVAISSVEDEMEAVIAKTQEDIDGIRNSCLSASAIEKYLACPVRFYYQYVKGLSVEEDVAESLDGGMIGRIFHSLMEALYTGDEAMRPECDLDDKKVKKSIKPLQTVDADYLKSWRKRKDDIRAKVDALIKKEMGSYEIFGRDLVTRNLIMKYVDNTIDRDLEYLKESGKNSFTILGLELKEFMDFNGFRFKGYIDRLDQVGNTVRVVDYKTGKVLDIEKNISDDNFEDVIKSLFSKETKSDKRPSIAFQLFMYDKLIRENINLSGKDVCNSIYHVTGLFKEPVTDVPVSEKFMQAAENGLAEVLNEISSPDTGFARTKDTDVCNYCDFKNICGR